jgi:hypothetical protein
MANLTQTDWDDAGHTSAGIAAQITNRKRTAGANNGKTIREVEYTRGAYKTSIISGVPVPDANIRIVYTDSVVEVLTFDGNTDFYPVGQAATV